MKKAHHSLCAY